jgi:hypothetical protein
MAVVMAEPAGAVAKVVVMAVRVARAGLVVMAAAGAAIGARTSTRTRTIQAATARAVPKLAAAAVPCQVDTEVEAAAPAATFEGRSRCSRC